MNPEIQRRLEQGLAAAQRGGQESARFLRRLLRGTKHEVINPAMRRTNRWLDQPAPRMTRRELLAYIAGSTALTFALTKACSEPNTPPPTPARPTPSPTPPSPAKPTSEARPTPEPTKSAEKTPRNTFTEPFEDRDANEAAKEIGFTAGSLFVIPKDLILQLSAYRDPELHAIYPPSVIAQKSLIYELSDKFGVPPNVIAIIMTIESAGYKEEGLP